jgi:ABC-type antimicrobial peptide transport system permease subunit
LTGIGLAIGIVLALLAAPVLRALPVDVRPPGFAVLGSVASLVAIFAMLACVIPARTGSRVDPITILRNE